MLNRNDLDDGRTAMPVVSASPSAAAAHGKSAHYSTYVGGKGASDLASGGAPPSWLRVDRLFYLNMVLGLVHLASGITLASVCDPDYTTPVFFTLRLKHSREVSTRFILDDNIFTAMKINYIASVVLLYYGVAHLLQATFLRKRYESWLLVRWNPFGWLGETITEPAQAVLLGAVVGITDSVHFATLIIAAACLARVYAGAECDNSNYTGESNNKGGKGGRYVTAAEDVAMTAESGQVVEVKPAKQPRLGGAYMAVPWLLLLVHGILITFYVKSNHNETLEWWKTAAVFTYTGGHLIRTMLVWRAYKATGFYEDYQHTEAAYSIVRAVQSQTIAWLIVSGTL